MMKCKYCGKEIEDGSAFCGYCGKKQPKVKYCVKCGREMDPNHKWCPYCGVEQTEGTVQSNNEIPNVSGVEQNQKKSSNKKSITFGIIALFLIVASVLGLYFGGVIGSKDSDFTTPDLKAFFLKGHVKEVRERYADEKEYSRVLRFDEQGNLVYDSWYNDQETEYEFRHNDKGQLTDLITKSCLECDDAGETFGYNDDGYPSSYGDRASSTERVFYTQYDEHNFPITAKIVVVDDDADRKYTYEYPEVDDHGNWIRKIKRSFYEKSEASPMEIVHEIEYYD